MRVEALGGKLRFEEKVEACVMKLKPEACKLRVAVEACVLTSKERAAC